MLLAELADPKVQTSSLLWIAVADICTCTGLYKSAVSRMHVCIVLNVTLHVTTWLHYVSPPQLLFGSTTTGTTPVAAAAALSALSLLPLSHDQCRSAKPSNILLLSSLPRAFAEHLLAVSPRLAHFAQCCQSLPMLTRAAVHRGLKVTPSGTLREVSRPR